MEIRFVQYSACGRDQRTLLWSGERYGGHRRRIRRKLRLETTGFGGGRRELRDLGTGQRKEERFGERS